MIDYKKLHSEKMQEESPLYEKKQITTWRVSKRKPTSQGIIQS
jgi:hypothetical protein